MPRVADLVKRLNETYQPDDLVATAIWCEADVIERAKERGITLTSGQADGILDLVDRKQDCSIGISWDTIDCFTDYYLEDPS